MAHISPRINDDIRVNRKADHMKLHFPADSERLDELLSDLSASNMSSVKIRTEAKEISDMPK